MADGQVIIQVKSNAKQAANDFNKLDKSLDNTTREAKKTDRTMSGLSDTMGSLGGVIATIGLVELGRSALQASFKITALQNKFKAAAGSAEEGATSFEFIKETTEELGLAFTETADAYAGFVAAATRSGLTLKESEEIFEDVARAATSLQLSGERVSLVFRALEQISSKGVVSMEELKLQLGDSLPGAVQIAAKAMGMTTSAFIDAVSAGEVMSKDFLPKFARQIEQELGGSAEEASQTLQSAFTRIGNSFDELSSLMLEEGSAINTLLKGFVNLGNGILQTFIDVDRAITGAGEALTELTLGQEGLIARYKELGLLKGNVNPLTEEELKVMEAFNKQLDDLESKGNNLRDIVIGSDGGDDGGVVTKEIDRLKELQDEAAKTKIQLQNLFLSGQEDTDQFASVKAQYEGVTKQIYDAQEATKGFQRQAQDSFDIASGAAEAFSRNAARSLFEPWQEGETAADRFKNIAIESIKDILAEFIAAELKKAAVRLAANIASGGFASFTGFAKGGSTGANGQGGEKVKPYAAGGIVGNGGGVVSKPTFFRNNGQLSVAGEVSGHPEGIMPLKRMSNGDMGVQANVAPVVNNIYNNAPVDVQVVSRPNNQNDIFINNLNAALANSQTSAGVTDALSRNSQSGTYAI